MHEAVKWFARGIKFILVGIAIIAVTWAFVWVGARLIRNTNIQENRIQVTMLDWASGSANLVVQRILQEFERTHPHIKVERQSLSGPYYQKLNTLIAANEAPDLIHLYSLLIPRFVEKELILDIEPFLQADTQGQDRKLDLEDFYPEVLKVYRYDGKKRGQGKLYSLPSTFSPVGIYYNKDLFDRAGVAYPRDDWTWDEFIEKARAIGRLEGCYGAWFVPAPWWWRVMLWTYGVTLYTGDFEDVHWNDSTIIEVLERYRKWQFEEKRTLLPIQSDMQMGVSLFRTGQLGMLGPEGRWGTVSKKIEMPYINWDYAQLPRGTHTANVVYTDSYFISKSTEHPREAWELLRYLASPEAQRLWSINGFGVPSRRSVAESDAFLTPDEKPSRDDLFLKSIQWGKILQVPFNPRIDEHVGRGLSEALVLGTKTARQALQDIHKNIQNEHASTLSRQDLPPMPWKKIILVFMVPLFIALVVVLVRGWIKRPGKLAFREELAGMTMISPWVVGFLVFTCFSMGISILLTLTKYSGMTTLEHAQWAGLANFKEMFFYDKRMLKSLMVTVYYAGLSIPVGQAAALAVALLMNNEVKGIHFFRGTWYLPTVLTGVAMAILWRWVFSPDHGLMNRFLAPFLGLFGVTPPDWFGKDAAIFGVPAFVIMGLMGVGGGMLIYLAGLKAIPKTLYEAAHIDGAGWWGQFRHVTLPMLSPVILFNVVIALIGSFQIFTQSYVMTPGGGYDDSTLFYVLYLYIQAFEFHEMGYASALAWFLFLIVLVLTLVVMKMSERRVHYEGMQL